MNTFTLEQQLLEALQNIIYEVMDYPPTSPYSADSYLPAHLIAAAQAAIKNYHDDAAALDIDLEKLNRDLEDFEKQGATQ
jgi:hypothetical protein